MDDVIARLELGKHTESVSAAREAVELLGRARDALQAVLARAREFVRLASTPNRPTPALHRRVIVPFRLGAKRCGETSPKLEEGRRAWWWSASQR
jgi:hypothetical protein